MPIIDYCYQQYVDLSSASGSDYSIPLTFTTGSYPSTTPQPITGWTINLLLKNLQSDPTSAAVLNINVTTHIDPVNGLTVVTVPAVTTATLSGYYYYYLTWIDNNGGTQLFQYGKINFTI